MEAARQRTSAKRVTKAKPREKLSLFDVQGIALRVAVKANDANDKRRLRWTRTAGKKGEAEGKFAIVGVPPKKITDSFAPPFISAGNLKHIMVPKEEDGEDVSDPRYSEENIIVTTIDLYKLHEAFPSIYENDLEENVLMPIYMVGTVDFVIKQLERQNVIPKELGLKSSDTKLAGKFRNWLLDHSENVTTFEKWTESKEYLRLLDLNPSVKKAEDVGHVDPEDVYIIIALVKAMGHHGVKVLDVNGVVICDYGQRPEKNVNNKFSDKLLKSIERDIDPNTTWTLDGHVFDISGLNDVNFPVVVPMKDPSIDKEGNPKESGGISHATTKFKVDGLTSLTFVGENNIKIDLSNMIYSDNSQAVKVLLTEINAVNDGTIGYKYKIPKTGSDEIVKAFAIKAANLTVAKYAGKPPKNDKVLRPREEYEDQDEEQD